MLVPLLDFSWQAQRILHLAQGEKKLESFVAVAKSDGKGGALEVDLQRLISSGRHRQETCESGMFGGQGADFLRRVAFWSIRSSGSLRWFRDILWQVQHFVWPGPAFSPQAQYWWKNRKKGIGAYWHESVSLVSKNCFVSDVGEYRKQDRTRIRIRTRMRVRVRIRKIPVKKRTEQSRIG